MIKLGSFCHLEVVVGVVEGWSWWRLGSEQWSMPSNRGKV